MGKLEKTNWKIDTTHSGIAFKVKHMIISTVTGYFENFEASIFSENENLNDVQPIKQI